ncbi:Putative Mob protein [Lactococcus lactis subsp. lactis A12]|uniref:Putative Mob protein n=2 Tax=Lactococcus lactis TaxID=1358 RepID=S6FT43_LACLL|nr:Putative Mob protein [Lactococcus lactis subsp. lactis A12]CDG04484.1 Putative Mob protein [Lactococcus lactis subsp. lactis A12]CDG04492.1 Putative Mob protein [Lactococcus lactis subsp. lactis A12]
MSKLSARNRQTDRNNVIRSVTCILSYPSGQKQPPKRDIISVKFQGVLAMQNTISIHVGNTSSIIHNNRKTENHTNPDIDVSRSGDNITLVQENIKDSYEKLFGEAVDEYNAKQKRADRKINNYLQKVKDSALDHQKEFIMQIGDYQSLEKIAEEQGCKVWETQEWQLRAETLKQAVLDFQVQNPNLYVYNAVIHLDELNPHAHVNFIPVGDNMKKGLSKQVSMNRALENMGYDAKFEVSSEAKNVKERGRIKLDNSKNFKNWRDDNLERVKEIAKEVYQKAGHEFEFIEGDKSQQHESVQAYKKTVEAAREKSSQIIQESLKVAESVENEAKKSKEELYSEWEKDWDKTSLEIPDFKFNDDGTILMLDCFDEVYPKTRDARITKEFPRQHQISIKDVVTLFKEKYSQLKDYIASKLQYLSHRETKIEKRENTLKEKETSFESKLETLNTNVKLKDQEFKNLDKLINAKTQLVQALSEESEVSMLYPDYAKVNKFTGNVTVPKEKWEAKHVSANSVNSALKLGETLSNIRVSNKNAFEHRMELASMEQSVLTEKNRADRYANSFSVIYDSIENYEKVLDNLIEDGSVTLGEIKEASRDGKLLTEEFKVKKGLVEPQIDLGLDKGFGMHL